MSKIVCVLAKLVIAFGLSYLPNTLLKGLEKVQEAGGDTSSALKWFGSDYECWWRIGFFLAGYGAITLLIILWNKGHLIIAILAGFFCFAIVGAFVMTSIGFYMDIRNGARVMEIETVIGWVVTAVLLLWALIYDIVSFVKALEKKRTQS